MVYHHHYTANVLHFSDLCGFPTCTTEPPLLNRSEVLKMGDSPHRHPFHPSHWFSNSPPHPRKFIEIIVFTDSFYLIHFQLNPIWPLFPLELFIMKVIDSYCQGQWEFLSSPGQPCSGHHCNSALPFLKHSPLPCFASLTSHSFTIHFADSFYSNQIVIMDFLSTWFWILSYIWVIFSSSIIWNNTNGLMNFQLRPLNQCTNCIHDIPFGCLINTSNFAYSKLILSTHINPFLRGSWEMATQSTLSLHLKTKGSFILAFSVNFPSKPSLANLLHSIFKTEL